MCTDWPYKVTQARAWTQSTPATRYGRGKLHSPPSYKEILLTKNTSITRKKKQKTLPNHIINQSQDKERKAVFPHYWKENKNLLTSINFDNIKLMSLEWLDKTSYTS